MPNCIELLDKTTNAAIGLHTVDMRICREVFNTEPHPKLWGSTVFNWYDTIAFQLASGKSLPEVREYFNTSDIWEDERPVINEIVSFLEANYNTRSFYSSRGYL